MREYIITIDESKADPDGGIPIKDEREVVRCRDCKRFDKETEKWCRFEHETAGVQWRTAEPDGFCKWGVRDEPQRRHQCPLWSPA